MTAVAQQKTAIRPLGSVNFPEDELTELRRRISATRWPERETVSDETARHAGCHGPESGALLRDGV